MRRPADPSPAAGPLPEPAQRMPPPRLYRTYGMLATFNVVIMLLALLFSHQLMQMFTSSVALHSEWVTRGDAYARLSALAAEANAPGNDIFESGNVGAEEGRLAATARAFHVQVQALHRDLRTNVPAPVRDDFGRELGGVERAMRGMTSQTRLLLADYQRGDIDSAGARMASMDRSHRQLNERIERLRQRIRLEQRALFEGQLVEARRLRLAEAVLGLLVLLTICATALYGRRLNRQAATRAVERERDVSQLRQAQQSLVLAHADLEERVRQRTLDLQSSEARTRAIIAHAHDAYVGIDADGMVTDWNPSAQAMFGWTAKEAVGQPLHELIIPEHYRAAHLKGMQHFHASGEGPVLGTVLQLTALHQEGHELPVELIITAIPSGDSHVFSAFLRDVTERQRAQQELDRFFHLSLDMLCIASPEGYFLRLNPAWESVLGYSADELMGQPFLDFVHPDDRAATAALAETLLQGVESRAFENRYRCKDGSWKWLLWQAASTADRSKIYAAARDITERRDAETALRDSEERFRLVSQATNDVIWDWDLSTGLVTYNRGFSHGFSSHGGAAGQQTAQPMQNVHPDDAARVQASLDAVIAGNAGNWMEEYRMRLGDGAYAYVLDRALVQRDVSGKATRMVGSMMDVSADKRLNEELREARDAAQTASRAKSEFLANMSHEIRTPMNGVLGTVGLLLDSELAPTERALAGLARASAEALLTLINDILDFSKIEAGKLSLETIPFDLLRTAEDIIEMLAPLATGKHLDLVLRFAPDVPRHVIGDPGRIRQVLTNLLGNALKFTEQGQVLLDVALETQDATSATLRIRVEDTGVGISPEHLGQMFDKFTQGDASTTRRHGGTGLGLAISAQLVELMGGEIGAVSTPGTGSTFWFTMRLPRQLDAPAPAPPPADLAGIRLLVVDDNAINRLVLHEQVASWGMRHGNCSSAMEALDVLRAAHVAGDPYRIAILDYQMPVMDGEMLGAAIKADPDLRDIVLVMLTSVGQRGDVSRLKTVGFAAYLPKPARQSELLAALVDVWTAQVHGHDATSLVTRHSLLETGAVLPRERTSTGFESRVLVVEDHPTNQLVASMILRKLGCQVDLAGNGREALAMIDKGDYDVVFMDCEMPGMDGFEATAAIRGRGDAKASTPIVAVTAQAMQGDRNRCLDAGMDDYISKPVQADDFAVAMQRWAPARQVAPVTARAASAKPAGWNAGAVAPPQPGELDADVVARLRSLAEASPPGLLAQVFASFESDSDVRIATLHDAAARHDIATLQRTAHALRGACANVGASALGDLARQLETLAATGVAVDAGPLVEAMRVELHRVRCAILALDTGRPDEDLQP